MHKERPTVPAAVKREVLTRYGFTFWSGETGEIDHRVPFFLGGQTNVSNLWPEAGPIPEPQRRVGALHTQPHLRQRDDARSHRRADLPRRLGHLQPPVRALMVR